MKPLFSRFHAEPGGPEWRESDWRIIDPLRNGRECPRPGCKAGVFGGKSWRDHWFGHRDQDAQLAAMDTAIRELNEAVKFIGAELEKLGIVTVTRRGEERPVDGIVIGNGPLPEEMRGGEA